MTQFRIEYTSDKTADTYLVPAGCPTPHGSLSHIEVASGAVTAVTEDHTGLPALLVEHVEGPLRATFHFNEADTKPYPEQMFQARDSRFTRFADDLVAEVAEIAPELSGLDRVRQIACATAERFTYGHPEHLFNDGLDEVPALGCGVTEGSCVDINTYFIASLRAAGFEAGYITGFYFPAEKGIHCNDGHCWVVTRVDGQCHEWDIAHFLKLGTRDIQPGLNPKPGFRAACFHSMGLDFSALGLFGLKALIEPIDLTDNKIGYSQAPQIRLRHPHIQKGSV